MKLTGSKIETRQGKTRRDVMDDYHPIAAFLFFALVLIAAIVFFHPLTCGIAVACGTAYAIWLNGIKGLRFFAGLVLPIMALTAIVNLLFVHRGVTVIGHIGETILTKEALIYGLCAGLMIGAAIMWFYCAGMVMTGDKLMRVFGKIAPSVSLMFSMILRFLPRMHDRARKIADARRMMGCSEDSKLKRGIKTVSVMTTWALENSIDTADSMRARGYGAPGRTFYSMYRWSIRDTILLIAGAALLVVCFVGGIRLNCYPEIEDCSSLVAVITFAVLCAIPMIVNIWEDSRWNYLQSRI